MTGGDWIRSISLSRNCTTPHNSLTNTFGCLVAVDRLMSATFAFACSRFISFSPRPKTELICYIPLYMQLRRLFPKKQKIIFYFLFWREYIKALLIDHPLFNLHIIRLAAIPVSSGQAAIHLVCPFNVPYNRYKYNNHQPTRITHPTIPNTETATLQGRFLCRNTQPMVVQDSKVIVSLNTTKPPSPKFSQTCRAMGFASWKSLHVRSKYSVVPRSPHDTRNTIVGMIMRHHLAMYSPIEKRGPCCRPPVTKVANDAQGWHTLTPAHRSVHRYYTPTTSLLLWIPSEFGFLFLLLAWFAGTESQYGWSYGVAQQQLLAWAKPSLSQPSGLGQR